MTNPMQGSLIREDCIYRATKWLAAFIIPFLVVAFALLFFWPNNTDKTFAWTIKPSMTPMMLASAYIGGVYYFVGVLLEKQWHHIKAGLLPVTAFASILSVATLLHWDRFNHSHISFYTWTALYLTTPPLVLATWLRNRRQDPGTTDPDDKTLPVYLRWVMGVVGVFTTLVSLILFLQPGWMIAVWPWQLTPLTARVIGAMFSLPGLVGLGVAFDSRWSSARLILQAQAFSILFILISAIRAWGDFDHANPIAYLFVGGLAALLVVLIVFLLFMALNGRQQGKKVLSI
jgi:hypothetical protein